MFCRNCGTNLETGAVFCGNCGTRVNSSDVKKIYTANKPVNSGVNFGEAWGDIVSFIISVIKKPMSAMSTIGTMKEATALILGAIVSLVAVVEFFMVKSIIFGQITKALGSYGSLLSSDVLKSQNAKLFMGMLVSNILVLAVGALVIFLVSKFLFKKDDFKYLDGAKVVVGAYTYTVFVMIVGVLLAVVSVTLGSMVLAIAAIVNIILIFKGVASFELCDENKALYVALSILVLSSGVQYVVLSNVLKSIFKSTMGIF